MNLMELILLAGSRTPGRWKYDMGNWEVEQEETRSSICTLRDLTGIEGNPIAANLNDGIFIAAMANHIDSLLAVALAAHSLRDEICDGDNGPRIFIEKANALDDALNKLYTSGDT